MEVLARGIEVLRRRVSIVPLELELTRAGDAIKRVGNDFPEPLIDGFERRSASSRVEDSIERAGNDCPAHAIESSRAPDASAPR